MPSRARRLFDARRTSPWKFTRPLRSPVMTVSPLRFTAPVVVPPSTDMPQRKAVPATEAVGEPRTSCGVDSLDNPPQGRATPNPTRNVDRILAHTGRGGCGIGGIADTTGAYTRRVVDMALAGLRCMEHRGGSIDDTGDGAGVLITYDPQFFRPHFSRGASVAPSGEFAVGVIFFPMGESANLRPRQHEIDAILRRHGLAPLGWRHVPVNPAVLGERARESRRDVWQVFIGEGVVGHDEFARALFRARVDIEQNQRDIYVASLAPRTVLYKALATGEQLAAFYDDLRNPDFRAKAALFHRRFSTNTLSNWYLAQPFRFLVHNGEINTIRAMRTALRNIAEEVRSGELLMAQGSDSATFDRAVDFYLSHGVPLPEIFTRFMPRAVMDRPESEREHDAYATGSRRAMGPLAAWEGPAAVVACDGRYLVGALDRMGLRPLRVTMTQGGMVVIASEIGAIPLAPAGESPERSEHPPLDLTTATLRGDQGDMTSNDDSSASTDPIAWTDQVEPGEIVRVNLDSGEVLRGDTALAAIREESALNFQELAEDRLYPLGPVPPTPKATPGKDILALYGWTPERVIQVREMAEEAAEPIRSMGFDKPLAVLSKQRPALTKYFKQIIAVVTNPPIDPIREGAAMNMGVFLGRRPKVSLDHPTYTIFPQYRVPDPFLAPEEIDWMLKVGELGTEDRPRARLLDLAFDDVGDAKGISARINEIGREALRLARSREADILVLSDRSLVEADDRNDTPEGPGGGLRRLAVPPLLALAQVANLLTASGVRRSVSLVVESGEIQEPHDAAVYIAHGADAVCPFLAVQVAATGGKGGPEVAPQRQKNLRKAFLDGLKRIMSKMGITSVEGYINSRLFEAVGLDPVLTDYYFPGTASRVGGIGLDDIYDDIRARHAKAKGGADRVRDLNVYRKEVWHALQHVARGDSPEYYPAYVRILREGPPVYLRDLLRTRPVNRPPVDLEDATPTEEIIRKYLRGAAMSHGALHGNAHRAISAAFNHFRSMANCGEGGEDRRRNRNGDQAFTRSRIRQVASARFGVDAVYLVNADELEIKIGQGAKPGEGGHLPGPKNTPEIAQIRRTPPWVPLISPPPHHTIYSIEDLAQLIFNLKQVNPQARVAVKCPSVTDLGTIAVGVAKAGADIIGISGFEGGTGAAAGSSIEHAGLPVELGLVDAHQALTATGIRGRVKLRADGGIKTGDDIVKLMLLGADQVALGSVLMVAEQCIMCHGCMRGDCPAGITTQDDEVALRLMQEKGKPLPMGKEERERFEEAKRGVVHVLTALAEDVRIQAAKLGFADPAEMVGHVECLEPVATPDPRWNSLKFDELLVDLSPYRPEDRKSARLLPVSPVSPLNADIEAAVRDALKERPHAVSLRFPITNTDRAVAATLSGAMAAESLAPPPGGIDLRFTGNAGQAFGFGLVDGVRLWLNGYANDAVGEAMSGGRIVIREPHRGQRLESHSLAGNAVGYGATGGVIHIAGRAGMRLGVRNSAAIIIAEAAGKYAFEYMTAGVGVVLGHLGPQVGCGMTGGVLYLLDDDGRLPQRLNPASVVGTALNDADALELKNILMDFRESTDSPVAAALLTDWATARSRFLVVRPKDAAKPPPAKGT